MFCGIQRRAWAPHCPHPLHTRRAAPPPPPSLYAPFLLGSLKAVGWVKRLLFNETPFKLALGTLRDIQKVTPAAAAGARTCAAPRLERAPR